MGGGDHPLISQVIFLGFGHCLSFVSSPLPSLRQPPLLFRWGFNVRHVQQRASAFQPHELSQGKIVGRSTRATSHLPTAASPVSLTTATQAPTPATEPTADLAPPPGPSRPPQSTQPPSSVEDERVRSQVFRLRLFTAQKQLFYDCQNAARASYNKTVEGRKPNNFDLYREVGENTRGERPKLKEVSSDVCRGGDDDACAAQQAKLTLQKQGSQLGSLAFRTPKDDEREGFALHFPRSMASLAEDEDKSNSLFLKIAPQSTQKALFEVRVRRRSNRDFFRSHASDHKPERSFFIQRHRHGHWSLIFRYTLETDGERAVAHGGSRAKGEFKRERESSSDEVVPASTEAQADGLHKLPSCDGYISGARTAWTIYTSDGFIVELGVEEMADALRDLRTKAAAVHSLRFEQKQAGRLNRRQRCSDQPRPFRRHGRARARLRRREQRILARHDRLVSDLHRRASSFLAKNADAIIMPRMQTLSMVPMVRKRPVNPNTKGHYLTRPVKSTLLAWRHCAFLVRLRPKAQDDHCSLLVQPEGYTTKTCEQCGLLHPRFGTA